MERLQGAVRDVAPRRAEGPHPADARRRGACDAADVARGRAVPPDRPRPTAGRSWPKWSASPTAWPVLTPIGELAGLSGLTEVVPTGDELRVPVGPGLLGRTISAFGEPLDGPPWPPQGIDGTYPVNAAAAAAAQPQR